MLRDAVAILQIGFSGFAFLMAALSFRLLRQEAARDGSPRSSLLKAIQRYTNYTLAMAVLVAMSRLGDATLQSYLNRQEQSEKTTSESAHACRDSLEQLATADARVATTYEELLSVALEASAVCKGTLRTLGGGQ